ncbi:FadR family transcriptional regulator [Nesterenkonia salmonea]|uniref:FadR family transcriptional regulator n=1 Tax=Nesterenkonia salmonea TaxID=1804987 RepID=A0A5R9B9L7_9MICC|nr:FadR/GntR family transcriptional regulator [Nesterenkonia salmonea]TLP95843.1 FadR family transcriptional regulator [Nesterenkonia salmonea]
MPRYPQDPAEELQGRLNALPASTPTAAVASELLRYFTSGGLEPGSRLPAERKLAEMLATGRSAVREALAALEVLGIVEVRPGSGTYLRSSASELLPRTLSWGLMLGAQDARDLMHVREALEVLAARLAAQNRDDTAVARLRDHLLTMSRHADLGDHHAFVEADAHFHQELAAIADNAALGSVLQSVRALLRVWVDRSVDNAADARRAIDEHTALVEAVRDGDVAVAETAMTAHMKTAGERIL